MTASTAVYSSTNQTLMLVVLVLVGTILLILILFISIYVTRKLIRHFGDNLIKLFFFVTYGTAKISKSLCAWQVFSGLLTPLRWNI